MLAAFKIFIISEGVLQSLAFSPEFWRASVIAPFHLNMSLAIVSILTHDKLAGFTVSPEALLVQVTALYGLLTTIGKLAWDSKAHRFSTVRAC